jgi:hypothetical protein
MKESVITKGTIAKQQAKQSKSRVKAKQYQKY